MHKIIFQYDFGLNYENIATIQTKDKLKKKLLLDDVVERRKENFLIIIFSLRCVLLIALVPPSGARKRCTMKKSDKLAKQDMNHVHREDWKKNITL